MTELIVRGTVRQAPEGSLVQAFDRDLRSEQALGRGPLGATGGYEIRYQGEQFALAEHGGADLVVRVYSAAGAVLAESPVRFNAGELEVIDLVVGADRTPPNEYAAILAELAPLVQTIPIAELREDAEHHDIAFLAGDTGRRPELIATLVLAHRTMAQTKLAAEGLYGLWRRGLPRALPALVALGTEAHRTALDAAMAASIISPLFARQADAFLRLLASQAMDDATPWLDPATLYAPVAQLAAVTADKLNAKLRQAALDAIGPVSAALGHALAAAALQLDVGAVAGVGLAAAIRAHLLAPVARDSQLAREVQAVDLRLDQRALPTVDALLGLSLALRDNPVFADDVRRARTARYAALAKVDAGPTRTLIERGVMLEDAPRETFDALVTEGVLTAAQATDLHLAFELGRLTGDNVPLMMALRGRNLVSAAELVGLTAADFQRLIDDAKLATPRGERSADYAAALAYNLEQSFPSAALVTRALADAGALRPHLEALLRANPTLDLAALDLFAPSDGLDWGGVPADQHAAVRAQLMTYQRVLGVSAEVADARQLLTAGYTSAFAIARETQDQFAARSGLAADAAVATYAKAKAQVQATAHSYTALHDVLRGGFKGLPVGNVYPALVNDLMQIDGFADLFGSQDDCDCAHCRSILSPAAYFVDLMYFVEQHISQPTFVATHQLQHPLYLKQRRGDLWTLALTCENTDTLVPYLTIVNEVLEHHLDALVAGDIWAALDQPGENHSTSLPFTLPLEELRLYLGHFGLGLHDVYALLGEPDDKVWRARLGLSATELTVITVPDPAGVAQRFGAPASLASFPVNDHADRRGFLGYAGITRAQLDDLRALRFRPDLAQLAIGQTIPPDELQSFPEVLDHLTADRLDFLHRFLRLWRKSGLAIADLDLVLTSLHEAGVIGTELEPAAIVVVAKVVELQAALKLTVEEICALATRLPVSRAYPVPPAVTGDQRLFERLFDLAALFGEADPVTHAVNPSTAYHAYWLDTAQPDDHALDPRTPMLLAALSVSETDLALLLGFLGGVIPFDANGDSTLDRDRLSTLYRHARLARALRLSVDDLVQLLQLAFAPGAQVVTSLDQIAALVELRAWLKASPFTVSELRFLVRHEDSAAVKSQSTPDRAAAIVLEVQAAGPADPIAALRGSLARASRVSEAQLADMLAWVATSITGPAVAAALAATFTAGVPDDPAALAGLVEVMRGLERVALLVANLKLGAAALAYVTRATAALGIADLSALTLRDLRAVLAYRGLAGLADGAEPIVQALLDSYQAAHGFAAADPARLAELWQVEPGLVASLVDSIVPPPVAIDAVVRFADLLARCQMLGVNGFSLAKLAADDTFARLEAARDVALGAFGSKYADEADRAQQLEPYQDQVNTLKRDALCDYMIARQAELKFRDRADIYQYFLLDVDMCGCFRTSRVVCATGSLQLYVQRCLLDLERSDPALNPGLPDARVDLAKIPADEWDWRKNYRVWEANRKVFLYPENYLEPDLRDNKSPIFEELEDELLQQKITKDAAEAAYRTYLKRFAELTRLKLAGAFRDDTTATYYFFAHTQQDPPQYYHRSWDGTTWTAWQPIALGINAPYVAAAIHLGKLHVFWVEGRTKEKDSIAGGSSKLDWYEVAVTLGYASLDEHGKWSTAQKLDWLYPSDSETGSAVNKIFDADTLAEMQLSKGFRKAFPRAVGDQLVVRYYNRQLNPNFYFDRRLDLFNNRLRSGGGIPALGATSAMVLFGKPGGTARLGLWQHDFASEPYFDDVLEGPDHAGSTHVTAAFPYTSYDATDVGRQDILHAVHAGYPRTVFTLGDQQYLIRKASARRGGSGLFGLLAADWNMVRLTTSLANQLGEILFSGGLDAFLSLDTQRLTEHPLGLAITAPASLAGPYASPDHLDFRGAYGDYYRELFFHVPFRIASHLNANQMFEDAKWWYERIFDPAASEPPSASKPTDRNWRYVEFRDVTIQRMKDALSDEAAIAEYRTHPFNPFAIARLRISAFQKTIVMKYVDNLLDWGDALFAQDTMEAITEATMLYVLASEILGKRPVKLGACKTVPDAQLTYDALGPAIDHGSELVIALENWHYALATTTTRARAQHAVVKPRRAVHDYAALADYQAQRAAAGARWLAQARQPSRQAPGLGVGVVQHHSTLAFCIPPNDDLLACWDRVEDRLFKIRNCMNLSGVRRSLALFAPPIDPMALVRAVAAGLSLDDALAALAAPVPPYRFTFLVEKAKQYVQTVQGFGGQLLAALEKKDAEELVLLRSVHERTILRMTRELKTRGLEDAQRAYQAVVEQQTNVQNRIDHYGGLIETGLTGWETGEQIARHTATALKLTESIGHMVSGIMYLIPQLGSPFAMKFGGKELGDSVSGFNNVVAALAAQAVAMAESTALEATFQRREEEWSHQLVLAQQDWKQVEQQRLAADLKVQIAQHDLDLHDKNLEQADELDDFYRNKFTALGLFEYLATGLNRVYRQIYNTAFDLAKMAERAFQFERDSSEIFIAGDNWQFDRAGLLAGERLILQLDQLEKAYLQRNTRDYEVAQSFSLAQLAPQALLALRETGACELSIPEVLLDMAYPGQYRRLIKAVRLTVPCVVGPYTNVGAKLTLLSSRIRRTPSLDPDALVDLANQQLTSIVASHGQNDAGLFELNFRDDRFLPFENAGAISTWRLELPAQTRSFDYDTISDVIVNLSYTAKDDGAFRQAVEAQLVDALTELAATQGLFRLFSLRHDFPNAFHRLLHPVGPTQTADLEITRQHFPYYLRDRELAITAAALYLAPSGADPLDPVALSVGNVPATAWSILPGTNLRGGTLALSGSPIQTWTVTAGANGLDPATLGDLILLVKYGLA